VRRADASSGAAASAPARDPTTRSRAVKTVFVLYAAIIVAGLVTAFVVGLTQS
jgi:hypothetical protein